MAMTLSPYKSAYVDINVENSVVIAIYKKSVTIDLQLAKQIVEERLALFNGKSYLVLIDARQIKLVTREARNYFAKEGVEAMIALGVIVNSRLSVISGNLFVQFSKRRVPTKLFKTKEQAMKWLSQFVTLGEDSPIL